MGKQIRVTYTDVGRDAPRVEQYGIEFITGQSVAIDIDRLGLAAPLAVYKWSLNPWFSVEGAEKVAPPSKAPSGADPRDIDPDDKAQTDETARDDAAKAVAAKAKADNDAAMQAGLDKLTKGK